MLREGTVYARKIIDFYSGKGIECSVVDEHSSLLVTLCADGEMHEFRCGSRAFASGNNWRRIYRDLEREFFVLRGAKTRRQEE